MFGSNDQWIGLGVFFDSFDNDNKHNNPYIMAMTNDGTKLFDHQNDGATQQLAGCLRDFRLVFQIFFLDDTVGTRKKYNSVSFFSIQQLAIKRFVLLFIPMVVQYLSIRGAILYVFSKNHLPPPPPLFENYFFPPTYF